MEKKSLFELTSSSDLSSVRTIAMSAGDFSIAVRQEVEKVLKSNRNNVVKSFGTLLQTLLERNLIADNEAKQLENVFDLLLNAIREKIDAEDAYFSIKKIYNDMITRHDSSPVALAMSSVASSSFNFKKTNSVSFTPATAGAGAVVGAGLGAIIGGAVGGPLGAGIGAAVGAVAGAAAGLCNQTGT